MLHESPLVFHPDFNEGVVEPIVLGLGVCLIGCLAEPCAEVTN